MASKLDGGRKNAPDNPKDANRDRDTTPVAQTVGSSNNGAGQPQPKMPHERDESARATGNRLDQKPPPSEHKISRAVDDLHAGRVDTDRRGIPDDIPAPRGSGKR